MKKISHDKEHLLNTTVLLNYADSRVYFKNGM